ncbi:WxL protein host-binding domain-containing protein [Lactococcus kimchii]|uniref:WxL protein host-binding domain-containing protein n=1 Tax=Lactococcus sp. S-13 TaxID=2507158 RepID=UPI0010235172|nr:DUF3324 domain-containing protein [Lactococcus sp. S-13]RZI49393.1 DUF3324 domain-containing protein [Lactococcus sp. S-13]
MKKFSKWFALGVVTLGLIGFGKTTFANEFNFSVDPAIPSNQVGKSSYFDLLLKPGQTQDLTVVLGNSTDKTVTVEQSVASATTNINGVVEYSPNAIKPDTTLKYNLVDYVKAPKEIVLKPKSTQAVTVQVTMPNESFSGVIAGGLTYAEKDSDSANSAKNKGISIKNKYAFVVGLLMQQGATKVAPDLKLLKVAPGLVNYRNVINVGLQNPKAGYLNQMYVNAEIKGLTNKSLDYKVNKESMQMAPNSNFNYPLAIGEGKKLEAGKYRLTMTVYGQKDAEKGQYSMKDSTGALQKFDYRWQFTQDFTITAAKAKALNAKDVTIKHEKVFPWMLVIGLLILLLALFLLFFILWKRRNTRECPECEAKVSKKDKFCQKCGAELPDDLWKK